MTKNEMMHIVYIQLAIDLNCTPDELNGEKDRFVFTEAKDNPGRRPFPRGERHFEILSMGNSIVISASPDILDIVKPELSGKGRDEAFSMPFIYGHALYYLPDLDSITPLSPTDGFTYEFVEQENISALYQYKGFHNALQYNNDCPRPDILVILAKIDGHIVGMAGASNDCVKMWQIGMDVLPDYRNRRLAAYLVNRLTLEILNRGYVPYYGTYHSNIASQRVAHRSGYCPAWINSYRGNFEGYEFLPTN